MGWASRANPLSLDGKPERLVLTARLKAQLLSRFSSKAEADAWLKAQAEPQDPPDA